jgi:hypothetical protein
MPPEGHKQEFTVTGGNDAVFAVQGIGAIKTVERLLADYQINLDQWHMIDNQIKTVSTDERTVYNVRVNLRKKELLPIKFAPIMPVHLALSTPIDVDKWWDDSTPSVKNVKTCLVIPDSQNGFYRKKDGTLDPMHDPRCWDLAHQLNATIKPDTIVLLGDMLDLAEWSDKYTSSPDMAFTTQETINDLALTLGRLRRDNPTAHIVYIEGNHEKRFQLAILNHLKAAHGLSKANTVAEHPTFSLPYLLGLKDLGIEWRGDYPDGSFYLNDVLEFGHGTIVRGGGGETAKAVLKDMDHSYCYGHVHRFEQRCHTVHKRDGSQEVRMAFSPGTISRIDGAVPANSKRNDWQQGLAVVSYSKTEFDLEMMPINEGIMWYRGKRFVGV